MAWTARNCKPLAGQTAFAGTDDGQSGGTWDLRSSNLAPYAQARDTIQVRFRLQLP